MNAGMREMALAIFRASLDVSLVWPNDHLQVVPAEHAGENDAVGVLHHERQDEAGQRSRAGEISGSQPSPI
jgi:hypothetical protein